MHHTEPDDFVVATEEFFSVKEFVERTFDKLKLDMNDHIITEDKYRRPNEVPALKGDATKIRDVLGWKPKVNFDKLIQMMIDTAMLEETKKAYELHRV